MGMRPMWTVVDGVHRKNNVLIIGVALILMIASVVFVQAKLVKVIVINCNVKNLSFHNAVPICNDGVKNGDEGDVDCGIPCLPTKPCTIGSSCNNKSDCASGVCTLNICQSKHDYLQCETFELLHCSSHLRRWGQKCK